MTEETKAKIKAAHLKRVQDDPAVGARLKAIANDPAMKAARSAKMKAKWADPEWRANQLAKRAPAVMTTNQPAEAGTTKVGLGIETVPAASAIIADVTTPVRKKRVITAEQKERYAAAKKAKRAAAKAAKLAATEI